MTLAGWSSTVPVTPEESVTSSTEAGAVLDAPTATRLDEAIGRAMPEASIPGEIVGIWGPAGDYVRTFGVADKATRTPMQTDFYSRVGSAVGPDRGIGRERMRWARLNPSRSRTAGR
jgi:D-alanyl-D-alanine carboxypeptidase